MCISIMVVVWGSPYHLTLTYPSDSTNKHCTGLNTRSRVSLNSGLDKIVRAVTTVCENGPREYIFIYC